MSRIVRATNQETCCSNDRTGSNNEHADTIDSRADDFHKLSKIFHEQLTCRKASCVSMLFVEGVPICAWWIGTECDDYDRRRRNYQAPQAHLHCQRVGITRSTFTTILEELRTRRRNFQ